MIRLLCTQRRVVERDLRADAFVPRGGYVIEVDEATADELWFNGGDPWPLRPLAFAKAGAIARVNADAGACRSKFITVIPGQETTYAEKRVEAEAFVQAPAPEPSDYPMLNAEALATGQTIAQVAAEVLALAEQWRALGAQIEGIRRGAIVAIQRATTTAEVDAVSWTFP